MTARVIRRFPTTTAGTSGWEALARRTRPVRALDGDVSADWLIIGAGFAGLSAARRLGQLRPGERVVVLDAQEVAKGPAGRNSGFMIDVPHNLAGGEYSVSDAAANAIEIRQNRHAIAFARDAAAEHGMGPEIFDPSGKTNAAASERGLRLNANYAQSLSRIGEPHTILDARQMRELTGTDYYRGGLFTPGAVILQPARYVHALADGLPSSTELFENSPVRQLRREAGLWVATSDAGAVRAPKAIVAVNGLIEEFGHFRGRLIHVFTYASMTNAFSPSDTGGSSTGASRWALLPADPMGATLRKISDGGKARLAIRTRFTYDPGLSVSERRLRGIAAEQRRSLDARYPAVARIPFEFTWAGALCLSRNHVPAFGEVEEDLYSACCENGLGTVKSTLAGMMAVELATGTHSDMLKSYMNHAVPTRLPPRPVAQLGINSVIRWQELRAGREG